MALGSEIERKFLLRGIPDDVDWIDEKAIRQGYVALDGDTEVRVRLSGSEATLTVKHGGGRSRTEEEVPLDPRQAESLYALTEGRRVEKTRRRTRVDGLVAEVDEYTGDLAGLCVAEVEFEDDAAADRFDPPGWFEREVTDDKSFKNRSLACQGLPETAR